ncbi:MAG: hypothetical protein H7Y17_12155 [Chlorobia bacterium]|nr:hypothetical protein [Fimbriimonadaceae bacterium]
MPVLSVVFAGIALLQSPAWPQTRAERSQFKETSTYADVANFLQDLQRVSAPITLQWMGKSTEGRQMPLVIASRPLVSTPAQAKASGKPIIYIQANIHAGEVEGKEAALALIRNYCREEKGLLDKVILLVTPIYNADGNEKFGPQARNRPGQEGPELVGLRANGQGLDLNRDCMKAESPEMRGILKYVYSWDPDVVFDLHTTDGSRHGYQLTYSPGLHPNTDPEVRKFTQDELLPLIKREVAKTGLRLFDYGNTARRQEKTVWETFGYEARYVTNYGGLRNRIAILSEAMVNCPFEVRVKATEQFVNSCLVELAKQSKRVTAMTRKADERMIDIAGKAPELGVRFEMADRGEENVLMEKASAAKRTGPITAWEPIKMRVFDRFKVSRTAELPTAYLIPGSATKVADLLRLHGVVVERLLEKWSGAALAFKITEAIVARNAFQGHKLVRLEGTFESRTASADSGWFLVRNAQPLGTLIFDLLEPESLDGVAAWGLFGEDWSAIKEFPILKVFEPVRTPAVAID